MGGKVYDATAVPRGVSRPRVAFVWPTSPPKLDSRSVLEYTRIDFQVSSVHLLAVVVLLFAVVVHLFCGR